MLRARDWVVCYVQHCAWISSYIEHGVWFVYVYIYTRVAQKTCIEILDPARF